MNGWEGDTRDKWGNAKATEEKEGWGEPFDEVLSFVSSQVLYRSITCLA